MDLHLNWLCRFDLKSNEQLLQISPCVGSISNQPCIMHYYCPFSMLFISQPQTTQPRRAQGKETSIDILSPVWLLQQLIAVVVNMNIMIVLRNTHSSALSLWDETWVCVRSAGGHRSGSSSPSQSAQGSPQRARSANTSPSQAFQPGPMPPPAATGTGSQKQPPQLK